MPIIRSAKKKLRQDKKRQKQNLKVKETVKSTIKKFRSSPTKESLSDVFTVLDKALKKNIFHHNKVARLKSNLSKLLGKKSAAGSEAKTPSKKKSPKKK